jgi:sorting nexin-4
VSGNKSIAHILSVYINQYRIYRMSSQPIDEDGFHSIAWDDAPPTRPALTDVSSPLYEDEDNGFETISHSPPTPPPVESIASTSTATVPRMRSGDGPDVDPKEWGGRWMSIEVKDPVKEQEGSKDMYVSYAVRTKVSRNMRS